MRTSPKKEQKGHIRRCRTISLLALRCCALRYLPVLLEIYVPTLRLAVLVGECECEYCVALLHRVFALSLVGS